MGGNIADGLAPVVVGALLAWMSWRTVVVINVVPGLVMATLILVMLGAFTVASSRSDAINAAGRSRGAMAYFKDFASLLKNRALMLVALSSSFRSMTQVGLLTFVPLYLAYEMGYSPFAVGVCLAVMQIAGFAAAPIGGHLSDKLGRKRVIMSTMLLSAVTIVFMAFAGKSLAFVLFIALTGFFLYATRAALQAWAVESTPREMAGSGVAIQFGIGSAGGAIAPAIFGMIADAHDLHTAFLAIAGTIILANVLIFFMPNGEAKQPKPVTA
jgi:predicted MFS family arabinose efflux permease